jgi:hypothetical protein
MVDRRQILIGCALAAGWMVVLAGPAALVWNAVRPEAWDTAHVRVRFVGVRYQTGVLVFTYSIQNRTGRSARFLPEYTTLRVVQEKGTPAVGYPVVRLPLDVEAERSSRVDLRLELAGPRGSIPGVPEEDWIVRMPDGDSGNGAESPEPKGRAQAGMLATAPASSRNPLDDVQGFELYDMRSGLRLMFPRAW